MLFGSDKSTKTHFGNGSRDHSSDWILMALLLLHSSTLISQHNAPDFAAVHSFDLTPEINTVDKILDSLFLKRADHDEVDCSVDFNFLLSGTIGTGERNDLAPFWTMMSAHEIIRSNYYVPQFSLQLQLPANLLNVDKFYFLLLLLVWTYSPKLFSLFSETAWETL